ncbi:hypothetical protein [Bacillus sp. V2I10]|uniref:hypothetical protein n=1 Tax=Bacillus sp. V2I10 TaxID=3042276 RepID=UPI002780096F|nr:hypothetical protein [Bacillus sp. V2I10]MDQ0860903.1 hypothetical protein [Bacillus sp. V2I10]
MLLKFAFQDFKEDREYQNLSKQTIKTYQIILGEFQKCCAEKEVKREVLSKNSILPLQSC